MTDQYAIKYVPSLQSLGGLLSGHLGRCLDACSKATETCVWPDGSNSLIRLTRQGRSDVGVAETTFYTGTKADLARQVRVGPLAPRAWWVPAADCVEIWLWWASAAAKPALTEVETGT